MVLLLALLVRWWAKKRPGLELGWPVAAAFALRVAAAAETSLVPVGSSLRGGDEVAFTGQGFQLSKLPLGADEWFSQLANGGLHVITFALQYKLLDSPQFALRITQAGIAVVGMIFLAMAVHELAGARAAKLAAWLLAIEPASLFFSSLLHKEAILLLAEGLVAYGGARLWSRGRLVGLVPMALGCLIVLGTRAYAAWFVIAGCAALVIHASLRTPPPGVRKPVALGVVTAVAVIVSLPVVWHYSPRLLVQLQVSQNANANDTSNLPLERVEYSSRADLALNLPRRVRDVLIRPYPWQAGNLSQQLGVFGSLFALSVLVLLAYSLWQLRGSAMTRAGPFLYLTASTTVAYALSVGNAGTGFRYRTHILALAICALVVLRSQLALAVAHRRSKPEELPAAGRTGVATVGARALLHGGD